MTKRQAKARALQLVEACDESVDALAHAIDNLTEVIADESREKILAAIEEDPAWIESVLNLKIMIEALRKYEQTYGHQSKQRDSTG